ncbi:hypothetical protein, partial [Pseudomonas aeruginosa]
RNPCCKGADEGPGELPGTQTKTCKPTRNPCCRLGTDGPLTATGTQAKTCKPTRNPCCKPTRKPRCSIESEVDDE